MADEDSMIGQTASPSPAVPADIPAPGADSPPVPTAHDEANSVETGNRREWEFLGETDVVPPEPVGDVADDQREESRQDSDEAADEAPVSKRKRKAEEKGTSVTAKDGAVASGDHARATNTKVDLRRAKINTLRLESGEAEKLSLLTVSAEDQRRISAVFTAPENYQDQLRGLGDYKQRIYVVHGAEQSGKYTCAVKLTLDLVQSKAKSEAKIEVYRRSARDRYSLIEFAHHPDVKTGTTYILEDAFENGVKLADLTGPDLPALNAALAERDNRLILTTEYQEHQLATLQVAKISASVAQDCLPSVLRKHLAYYRNEDAAARRIPHELIKQAEAQADEIAGYFHLPAQVEVFCGSLRELPANADEKTLKQRADWVKNLGEDARAWFDKLSENSKLYALLVVLFDSIDRRVLDDIYVTAVQELRLQGVATLRDPREQGLNDLLFELHARQNEARQVRFDNQALEREARRQVDNHRYLLWSLVNLLLAMIEDYQAPEYWEFRTALGAAIGALGAYQLPKLKTVLEQLADHPSGGVVAVAGYALDQLCRYDAAYHDFVVDLLEEWTRSGDPDRMWAAGASIWRVYDGLAVLTRSNEESNMKAVAAQTLGRVRTILTTLAERFDQFSKHAREEALRLALRAPQDAEVDLNGEYPLAAILHYELQIRTWTQDNAGSVLHAVRQIARGNASDAVELLSQWLRQDNVSHLQDIAILASQDLFYRTSSANFVLTSERHLPLLDLIGPLLTADVQATQIVLQTLLHWLRNPDWPNQIHRALLRVANRVAEQEAKSLQSVLLHEWLDSDQIEAHQIASSVLGRLSMMSGCPMDMPENGQAVIILDAAPEACRGRNAANAGYQLHARLDALLDTWVLRMGQSEALVQPRHPKPSPQLQPAYPRPRLLVPALDSLDPERVALAVALAWKSPLDGEDLVDGPWPERLIAAFADGASRADAPLMVDGAHQQKGAGQSQWWAKEITMPANSLSLHHLENAMLQQLAGSLADRPAAAWWSALENAIDLPENDLTGIREKLAQWTALLDDEQHAGLARTILCGTLWLCATDPGEYASLLSEWFGSPNELTRLAAAACGTAIFRLYAECQPSPDLERVSVLLNLAPFLAKGGWRRAQVVVAAARRWSKDPAWATRLLVRPDGGTGEIIRMVDSLPLSDHSKLQIELASWLDASAVQKESSEPVRKLVQRLQVQMALAVRTSLPELPAGQAYVMMVLDHANGHSKTVRDIAEMARHLIERLNQTDQEALHVLVYRLGQDVPIAGPEERPSVEQLSVQAQPLRPRVLGPLLELYSPRQIGAVILLTGSPPLDAEDWVGTEWNQHMLVHSVSRRSHEHPIFDTIPQQSSTEATGTLIVQRLRQITGV